MSSMDGHKDQVIHDLTRAVRDAEELLRHSEIQASESLQLTKEKIENRLRNAKARIAQIEDAIVTKSKEAAKATDSYVKENPWQSVGVAAAIGVLAGMLMSRMK